MELSLRPQQFNVQLGARRRLVLPAALRRELELEEGDHVVLTLESSGEVRFTQAKRSLRRFRGMLAAASEGRSLADELIAERREEALGE